MNTAPAAILLNTEDNVLVCCRTVATGERVTADQTEIVAQEDVAIGHKLARKALAAGDKVIKYGMPIGSMTAPVEAGGWVHMHNMKSDYISAHTREVTP